MTIQYPIPISSPDLTQVEIDAVNAVLHTPILSIGPQIEVFERALARGAPSA